MDKLNIKTTSILISVVTLLWMGLLVYSSSPAKAQTVSEQTNAGSAEGMIASIAALQDDDGDSRMDRRRGRDDRDMRDRDRDRDRFEDRDRFDNRDRVRFRFRFRDGRSDNFFFNRRVVTDAGVVTSTTDNSLVIRSYRGRTLIVVMRPGTTVVNRFNRPVPAYRIAIGDQIEVSGVLLRGGRLASRIVSATYIRDLSLPPQVY